MVSDRFSLHSPWLLGGSGNTHDARDLALFLQTGWSVGLWSDVDCGLMKESQLPFWSWGPGPFWSQVHEADGVDSVASEIQTGWADGQADT